MVKYLSQAKQYLIAAVVVCICIRIIFMMIAPLLPYLLGGLIMVAVVSFALSRSRKL